MEKIILFGAGYYGNLAAEFWGCENIDFYVDNDSSKNGKCLNGIIIKSFDVCKEELKGRQVIICVSEEKVPEIKEQLEKNGIFFDTFESVRRRATKEKIEKRTDYIGNYQKAVNWIKNNTIVNEGIINNTDLKQSYPEVTGYYIPTLLKWGFKDLAKQYALYLCNIQNTDGSWSDTLGKNPYVFDTAQIIKGLLAISDLMPEVTENIIRGCDWLVSTQNEVGQLVTPSKEEWGDDESFCNEAIHIYCLSPLYVAGKKYHRADFVSAAHKAWLYYKEKYTETIMNFSLLSHFQAYLIEALIDINETEMAKCAMENIEKYQSKEGYIPAFNNVNWVCSTGLFQMALIWYRLGDKEKGDKAFDYGCRLQNESGGWYGCYVINDTENTRNLYFPYAEISWANKYFLDALYYKNLSGFDIALEDNWKDIDENDGRYSVIKDVIQKQYRAGLKILDIGCGRGRYIKNFQKEYDSLQVYGADISPYNVEFCRKNGYCVELGSLLDIPFTDENFDITYTCEALEHAIDVDNAIGEMARVTKPYGTMIIVDKNIENLGQFEIGELEQWFSAHDLKERMRKYCDDIQVVDNIEYENRQDGLFCAWIGRRKYEIS